MFSHFLPGIRFLTSLILFVMSALGAATNDDAEKLPVGQISCRWTSWKFVRPRCAGSPGATFFRERQTLDNESTVK